MQRTSQGKGLRHDFLRHVERCAALVHVLDCATTEPGRDPITDLDTIEAELAAYEDLTGPSIAGTSLKDRPRIVALNKIDVPEARDLADLVKPELEARGLAVYEVSAATTRGPARAEVRHGRDRGAGARGAAGAGAPARVVIRPAGRQRPGIRVPQDSPRARTSSAVTSQGAGLRQTDFTNEEAVGYLGDRLARLGVEEALAAAGAQPGDEVLIGEDDDAVVFDWDPTLSAGRPPRARPPGHRRPAAELVARPTAGTRCP